MKKLISEEEKEYLWGRDILNIAIPAVFEVLFTTFASIIDTKMVSSLGTVAISAIAVTDQPKLFVMCAFLAINTVISALVALKQGQEDRDGGNRIFVTALVLVAIGSVLLGIVASLGAKGIMTVCSGQADTMDMSVSYFRIIMLGMVFNTLFMAINAALRGCGNTKITFVSNVISCLVHILFNFFLIEGNCGFPAMGVKGAALSILIGNAAALIFGILYMFRTDAFVSFKYVFKNKIRPAIESVKEIFALWKNVVVENLMMRVGFLITSSITARVGSLAMSIYAVGMHLMNINFAIGNGFQTSAVALIGKCRGAGKYGTMRKYSKKILEYGLTFAVVLSVLIVIFARPYYGFFNDDAAFIQTGVYVCWIIAAISPLQVSKLIFTGYLQGLGAMKQTMIAAIISVTFVQPVANLLFTIVIPWGIWGIWLSVFVSQGTWLLIMRHYYSKVISTFPVEDVGIEATN